MKNIGCSRLDEVRQTLNQGHWPEASSPELRIHVDRCERCAQEVLLTKHFQLARVESMEAAQLGSSSLLWWRAQARRRNAALERAGRPLAAAQFFALAIVAAVIVAVIAWHWDTLLNALIDAPKSLTALLGDWGAEPLVLGLGVVAMLGGVVVYLTAERR